MEEASIQANKKLSEALNLAQESQKAEENAKEAARIAGEKAKQMKPLQKMRLVQTREKCLEKYPI